MEADPEAAPMIENYLRLADIAFSSTDQNFPVADRNTEAGTAYDEEMKRAA